MKKILFYVVLLICFQTNIYTQVIPNSSFENWTIQTLYEQPNLWLTSNPQLSMMGMAPNCTQSTDSYSGNFAAQIETVTNGQDTVGGILLIGMPGNQTIDGGEPFNARPDTVIVHLKYNILLNDTGHFIVFFKNNTNIIGTAGINIIGSQITYGTFKLPVTWSQGGNADTIAALVSSSNLDFPGVPGSYILIDGISLTGTSLQFPNGDFEGWVANLAEEPDDWTTLNYAKTIIPSAIKVTDSYSGTYAIRVETIQTIWGQILGYITNGLMGQNGPEGGVPVSQNPCSVTGYYKYIPTGLDTAVAFVFTSRYDAFLDSTIMTEMAVLKLLPASTYTPFEINLFYNAWPWVDTINISFASSNLLDSLAIVGLGSALFLDSLNINFMPVNTGNIFNEHYVEMFPNPASDVVFLNVPDEFCSSHLFVYDMIGRKLLYKRTSPAESSIQIDISDLSPGIYFIELHSEKGKIFKEKLIVN